MLRNREPERGCQKDLMLVTIEMPGGISNICRIIIVTTWKEEKLSKILSKSLKFLLKIAKYLLSSALEAERDLCPCRCSKGYQWEKPLTIFYTFSSTFLSSFFLAYNSVVFQRICRKLVTVRKILKRSLKWNQSGIYSFIRLKDTSKTRLSA